jgi:hypothetical protein
VTGMTCPSREDLVAYSLGALDPDEARSIDAHAPACERCTRELEALAPAVAVLGESVEQLEPPATLRENVLSVVREEASRKAVGTRDERRGVRRFVLRPAAGLAALAVAGAGVAGYLIHDEGDGGGGETVPVTAQRGVGGTLAVGDLSSMLTVHGMPPVPKGEVYQVWVEEDSSVRPSSNFIPDPDGNAMTGVDGHLSSGMKVMVTKESGPGHQTPTMPVLLTAAVD